MSNQSTIDKTPSDKQLKYLRNLGYAGPAPATSGEASKLIEEKIGKKPNSPTPQAAPQDPVIVHEEATEEDLRFSEALLKAADKFHRLAVTSIKKRGEPLRGDIINAERNFLLKVEKFRTCNNS